MVSDRAVKKMSFFARFGKSRQIFSRLFQIWPAGGHSIPQFCGVVREPTGTLLRQKPPILDGFCARFRKSEIRMVKSRKMAILRHTLGWGGHVRESGAQPGSTNLNKHVRIVFEA